MKALLVSIDSKFIHANLAVRYLKNFCSYEGTEIEIKEFTINQQSDYILGEILDTNPDIICFSCYIWNIEYIKEIAYIIKESEPDIKILWGGPEVSYETEKLMKTEVYIDFVIFGEGEMTFMEFMKQINHSNPNYNIKGLAYRENNNIYINEARELIDNLDIISYPYSENEDFTDKIIYYESSRGCPFNCSFCMSSINRKTRNFSIDRVKKDLKKLLATQARQIKFVDRTFNADYRRAMEIMEFIIKHNSKNMTIHFEITADIINDSFLSFLKKMPVNMFQFEIGVQSLNENTLQEINRNMNKEHLCKVIDNIGRNNNIHMHLDLIAGLPYENYESFKDSFNGIYLLNAEKLQLGFLKVLKGTKIYSEKNKHRIKYRKTAPYEVISTKYIAYREILKLKKIEELVDRYYNEKYFEKSLSFIVKKYYKFSPFDFYQEFSEYWQKNNLYKVSHSRKKLYEFLYNFMIDTGKLNDEFAINMRYDYIFNNQYEELPMYLDRNSEEMYRLIKRKLSNDMSFRNEFFSESKKEDKIINDFRLVKIGEEATIFIYNNKNNIFNRCKTISINHIIKELENE